MTEVTTDLDRQPPITGGRRSAVAGKQACKTIVRAGSRRPSCGGHRVYLPGLYRRVHSDRQPAYTYPESLPLVNASGGPNCRGLPDIPSKQTGGSWYRSPFLVTDNAYVPYQPNTELSIDAPSTSQFLFHGAYAERDDY
ncbi:hypothetical protein MMAN_43360 [Mycobacterium mantenii]|uniref:Uncharacterized protein n=1 Tax=Mycobacterium mantenii TaxID=560555 RepID=A0ABN6AET9_MYCNT|nr:hypothetical protein MMAN_43360 [Mycobacterium mantenii]